MVPRRRFPRSCALSTSPTMTPASSPTTPKTAGGASASPLARAVPEGVISLEDGRHVVDSAYLAPRLGLDVETLRVEMHAGRVLSREERGEGEDADRVRLTFRHGDRAWSALIQPDGRIVETPPSLETESTDPECDAALAAGVRAFLEALPPDSPSVGYAQIADALDVSPPHRVGHVARALAITMGEDAAAGRPFLAALVVGRARGGLPARGFYDRAAALGRGPEPGETEAAFYNRELAATRAWLAGRPSNAPPRGAWRRWFRQRVGRRRLDRIGFVDRRDSPTHVPQARRAKVVVTPEGGMGAAAKWSRRWRWRSVAEDG